MIVLSRRRGASAALAILLSACGGAVAPSPTPAPTPAGAAIDIQGFKFPANTDIAKGTKVTWTNKDTAKHTVTSGTRPTKDGKFDGQLDAAGTFSFTFTETGTYSYYCTIHSSMNATITVR